MNRELGLFAVETSQADEVLSGLIEERVFWGDRDDYLVWKNSASDAAG